MDPNAMILANGRRQTRHEGGCRQSKQPETISLSRIPLTCRDSSLQARVVMDQISRERGQQYQESVVQSVLGKQGESHVQVSESRPFGYKLKFPDIDGKNVHAHHCSETIDRQGTLARSGVFQAKSKKLPATSLASHKPGRSITKPPNSLPSCSSASSSGGKISSWKPKDGKRQTRHSIHKNRIDVRTTTDMQGRKSEVGVERSSETNKSPKIIKMPRSRTFDAIVRKRTPAGNGDIHQSSLGSRTRLLSNNHSDNKTPIIKDSRTSNQNVSTKWKTRSEVQSSNMQRNEHQYPQGLHENEHPNTKLLPGSLQLTRERSFEITFPGYDTRFLDLPEPIDADEYRDLHVSDIDKKIDTRIHASSVEKCRRWLNKWVLPP